MNLLDCEQSLICLKICNGRIQTSKQQAEHQNCQMQVVRVASSLASARLCSPHGF